MFGANGADTVDYLRAALLHRRRERRTRTLARLSAGGARRACHDPLEESGQARQGTGRNSGACRWRREVLYPHLLSLVDTVNKSPADPSPVANSALSSVRVRLDRPLRRRLDLAHGLPSAPVFLLSRLRLCLRRRVRSRVLYRHARRETLGMHGVEFPDLFEHGA